MNQEAPGAGASPGDEQPLDSWKEIARYLRRSVRTVQSWEKSEGLPVHRHLHQKAGTVYAFPSEIDRWQRQRDPLANGGPAAGAPRRGRVWLALALVVTAALAVLTWRLRGGAGSAGDAAPLPRVEPRDWLLIANFDNLTGVDVLDGTLEAALRRELAGFVKLAPEERLGDILRQLGRPVDAPIDAALARELARSDNGIRAVLIGRIENDDLSLRLTLDLLGPQETRPLASLSEVADGPELLLPALEGVSHRIHAILSQPRAAGEEPTGQPERAAGTSLQVLQLHALADRQLRAGGPRAAQTAERLLRDALAEDPAFAPAYTLLALALFWQDSSPAEHLAAAEEASERLDRATLTERYFIRGSLHHLRALARRRQADAEEALAQYRALLELDPGHYWGRYLIWHLDGFGLGREALAIALRSLGARPRDTRILSQVAYHLVVEAGDLEQASSYVERARALQRETGAQTAPSEAWLEFYLPHELWVRGDVEGAVREVDRIVDGLVPASSPETRNLFYAASAALHFYLDLGMYAKAERLQRLYSVYPADLWEGLMARQRLDRERLAALQRRKVASAEPALIADGAWDLAQLGFLAEAEALLARLPENLEDHVRADVLAVRGELALAAGRHREAVAHLEKGLALRPDNGTEHFNAVRALARAWAASGEPEKSVRLLEEATRKKPRVVYDRDNWLRVPLDLARLYRQLGRTAEAAAIESELLRSCAWADSDYPILRELEKLGSEPAETVESASQAL